MHIPVEFDECTPTWVTAVLDIDDECTDVRWERIAEGVGLLGRLARLHCAWRDGTGPETLIVKMQGAIPEMVEQALMFGFYDREVNFYRLVGDEASVRVPHCYHVDAAAGVVPFVLVLEDLASCRIVDQLLGCEVADACAVARAAARLHAPWWDRPELHDLHWLPAVDGPLYAAAQPVLIDAAPRFGQRWHHLIGDDGVALGTAVAHNLNWFQRRSAERGPLTMCHYDLRLDNLLFDDDDGSVAMIDFQLMATQRGPYDLAYFLGWSLTPEQRRAATGPALDAYVDELATLGVTADRAWVEECYRESMLGVVAMAVTSGVDAPAENERGEALIEALVVRSVEAAFDCDAMSYLP